MKTLWCWMVVTCSGWADQVQTENLTFNLSFTFFFCLFFVSTSLEVMLWQLYGVYLSANALNRFGRDSLETIEQQTTGGKTCLVLGEVWILLCCLFCFLLKPRGKSRLLLKKFASSTPQIVDLCNDDVICQDLYQTNMFPLLLVVQVLNVHHILTSCWGRRLQWSSCSAFNK